MASNRFMGFRAEGAKLFYSESTSLRPLSSLLSPRFRQVAKSKDTMPWKGEGVRERYPKSQLLRFFNHLKSFLGFSHKIDDNVEPKYQNVGLGSPARGGGGV